MTREKRSKRHQGPTGCHTKRPASPDGASSSRARESPWGKPLGCEIRPVVGTDRAQSFYRHGSEAPD